MRQFMEVTQNQNHSLQEHISSFSYRDIRTAHPHSIDDVISPKTRRKVEYINGEALVKMSSKAQVNLLYLPKDYK